MTVKRSPKKLLDNEKISKIILQLNMYQDIQEGEIVDTIKNLINNGTEKNKKEYLQALINKLKRNTEKLENIFNMKIFK